MNNAAAITMDQIPTRFLYPQFDQRFTVESLPSVINPPASDNGHPTVQEDIVLIGMFLSVKYNSSSANTLSIYNNRNSRTAGQNKSKAPRVWENQQYKRMFTLMDVQSHDLFIILEQYAGQEIELWGTQGAKTGITIGDFVAITEPEVNKFVAGHLPIVESHRRLAVVSLPVPNILELGTYVNQELTEYMTPFFIPGVKNNSLQVSRITAVRSSCSGRLCDRQDSCAAMNCCGCYEMDHRPTSTEPVLHATISLRIDVFPRATGLISFQSWRFSNLIFRGGLVRGITTHKLNANIVEIRSAWKQIYEFVSQNGGWTLFGWYKAGKKSDASTNEAAGMVVPGQGLSETFAVHLVYLYPTNSDVVASDEFRGLQLDTSTLREA